MAHITLNGRQIEAPDGETLLSVTRRSGISLPTLCHIEGLEPVGSCRLCVVEVSGYDRLVPACSTVVSDGMTILTHSPRVLEARRTNLELLLAHHADDCLYCSHSTSCEIRCLAADLGLTSRRFGTIRREAGIDKTAPGFLRDSAKCVLCGRCVHFCDEIQSIAVYDFAFRGATITVDTSFSARMSETSCVRCGQCVRLCPTGALADNLVFEPLLMALRDPERIVVLSFEPAVIPAIARSRNLDEAVGRIAGVLRIAGFDRIFDTHDGWEAWITETVQEITQNSSDKPIILSFCPAAIRFIESHLPSHTVLLSGAIPPFVRQKQILASSYATATGFTPESFFTVLATPCLAARDATTESSEPDSSFSAVLTTRDLLVLLDTLHLDPAETLPVRWDREVGAGEPDAYLTGITGDIAARVANRLVPPTAAPVVESLLFPGCRIVHQNGDHPFNYAIISGLGAARRFLTEHLPHLPDIRFVEISACPGGCRYGGGQPRGENK